MDRKSIRGKVHELYRQGKTPKQIAIIMEMPLQTVYELTCDIPKNDLGETGAECKLKSMVDFQERWINAINPIRRYYGLEPMELERVCE